MEVRNTMIKAIVEIVERNIIGDHAQGRPASDESLKRSEDEVLELLKEMGVPVQRKRRARVLGGAGAETVASYLPRGYEVVESPDGIFIEGYDHAGWTLHEYVMPRLQSGLIATEEIFEEL